ncbi:MAG: hypothetical protein ACPH4D_04485 [Porticoccaceae bacterium]
MAVVHITGLRDCAAVPIQVTAPLLTVRRRKILCDWPLQNTRAPVALVLPDTIAGDVFTESIIRAYV